MSTPNLSFFRWRSYFAGPLTVSFFVISERISKDKPRNRRINSPVLCPIELCPQRLGMLSLYYIYRHYQVKSLDYFKIVISRYVVRVYVARGGPRQS